MFFNGDEVRISDKPADLMYYFMENGMNQDVAENITYKEKSYAFFRGWMDQEMDRKDIIKAIREMIMQRVTNSEDISTEEWKKIFGDDDWENGIEYIAQSDNIYLPDISFSELKKFSPILLCGGGKDECLSEFRFLLEAVNIPYKLIKSLIY